MVETNINKIIEEGFTQSFNWSEPEPRVNSDSARYLGDFDKDMVQLVSEKFLLCTEIVKQFKKEHDNDTLLFHETATRNQVLHDYKNYTGPRENQLRLDTIKDFLAKYSLNFQRINQIKHIAEGGEAIVYGIDPFIPVEAAVRVSKSKTSKLGLVIQNQFIRLLYNEEFICKVLEEIIIYDKRRERAYIVVSINEIASCDMQKLSQRWIDRPIKNPYKQQGKQVKLFEDFSEEKLLYITIRTMMALQYLHSKNVIYCDLKPQNILIFRNWQVKFGDFGGALGVDYDQSEYYKVKSCTKKYSKQEFIDKVIGQKFSKQELFEHEYYTLWKSFSDIQQMLTTEKYLDTNSKFHQLVNDLKDFKQPLDEKINKWSLIFKNDEMMVCNIYEQFQRETKLQALPQIFKLTHAAQLIYFLLQEQKKYSQTFKLKESP